MDQIDFLNLEYFFNLIVELFRSFGNPEIGVGGFVLTIIAIIKALFTVFLPIAVLLLIVLWIYYQIRFIELRRYQKDRIYERLWKKQQEAYTDKTNERWNSIEELFNSESEGDWRLAIIEADSMLEELIVQLGYPGENLGERLKNVPQGDFSHLQEAWEAHLVRNKIAHEGMNYELTEREKRRVHSLYKQIFKNAEFI